MDDRVSERGDDMLSTLVTWFEDSEMATQDARNRSENDRDFYDGKQLTADEIAALEARKQPPLVINRVRRKVDYLAGLEKQSRQDPKAYPRNPQDEQAANAATDALRYVCDLERFPLVASRCWENGLIEGAYGVDVCVEEGGETGYRIRIKRVPWDRMFWDPHSAESDFSDAKYLGLVMWMDESDALARWPEAREAIEGSYAQTLHSDTYDDRPKFGVWGDGKRKRVRIAQIYWQSGNGAWMYAAYTKGGYLDEAQPSPYEDDDGQPACPLVFQSAYVDRDNARYGVVRDMIDPQKEINKRRSKALHLLSVRQIILEDGAVQDEDVARREAAKPDGLIRVAPGARFEFAETNDLAAGQAQLLAEAKAELDGMGPNATMQGKQGDSTASGRAIALSQQGGLIEVGMLLDSHREWKRRVYSAIWHRVRQFWTHEVWVRVTDDDNKPRFVGLNVPQVVVDPYTGQEVVVGVENEAAKTVIDIVVDEAPDVVTLQSEQQEILGNLMAKVPVLAPVLIKPLLRNMNLRDKDEIVQGVEQLLAAPQGDGGAAAAQQQQAMAEMQMRQQSDAAKIQADLQSAELKAANEREIEAMRIAAEDQRHQQTLAVQWQTAQLQANIKAQDRAANDALEQARMSAEDRRAQQATEAAKPQPDPRMDGLAMTIEGLVQTVQSVAQRLEDVAEDLTAPREIVRGADGRATGIKVGSRVRQIQRGDDGRAAGLI